MAKVTKIIYVVEATFSKRDYERFGVETVRDNGFAVEVWDLTPALHPDIYGRITVKDAVSFDGCRLFHSKSEATAAAAALGGNVFVVIFVFYDLNSYPVFRALSGSGARYAMSVANAIPPVYKGAAPRDLWRRLKAVTPQKISNRIFFRVPFDRLGVRPATLLLAGGEKSTSVFTYYPVTDETKTVWCHTFDYDIYLRERLLPRKTEQGIGVFLDEDLCFHPDYLYRKHGLYTTPEEYFGALRRFFDFLRTAHGVEIVIAAHPRSTYEERPDYFGKRPVVRDRTVEMVQTSAFAIAHSSTSINYAVLFNKPIIFITTDDLTKSPQGPMIETMPRHFNKKAINLNGDFAFDWEDELKIDERAYASYKEAYIKRSISADLPFWQIFSDEVKSL
jgi:hypothetical protein